MQSAVSVVVSHAERATSSGSPSELTAKDGLFIATECHLALLPDEDGDTALHLAVVQEDIKSCEKFVKLFSISGKSIDVHNNLLQTPLHVAVITNQNDIVKLFIQNGANPNTPDRFGSTSIHLCAKYNSTESLIEILQNVTKPRPDFDMRDYEGHTALHIAVISRSIQTLKVLLAHGADIDAKDNKGGRTPLVYAIEQNDKNTVEVLLESDASVSQQTYSGDTALHIASGRGLQDIVRLLLRRGADASSKYPSEIPASPLTSDAYAVEEKMRPAEQGPPPPEVRYTSHFSGDTMYAIAPEFLRMVRGEPLVRTCSVVQVNEQANERSLMHDKKRKLKIEYKENDMSPIPAKKMVAKSPQLSMKFGPKVAEGLQPPYLSSPEKRFISSSPHLGFPQHVTPFMGAALPINMKMAEQRSDGEQEMEDFPNETVGAVEEVVVTSQISSSDSEDKSSAEERENRRANVKVPAFPNRQFVGEMQRVKMERIQENPATIPPTALNSGRNAMGHEMNRSTERPTKTDGNRSRMTLGKAVVVRRIPQVESATALSNESKYIVPSAPTHNSSDSPLSRAPSRASSKPSSPVPNPTEVNLYQLAREGLAVAAMANSARSHQILQHDYSTSSSPKSLPSRQAKIKSGTEELQNLALQGLAVAAMTSQGGSSKDQQDSGPSTQTSTTSMTQHLSKFLNTKVPSGPWPPELNRSLSLPPYVGGMGLQTNSQASPGQIASNNSLLALAHANARKENVGQAISAIPMVQRQGQASTHRTAATDSHHFRETPESTKLKLKAIINKNAELANSMSGKILDPATPKFKPFDPQSHKVLKHDPVTPKVTSHEPVQRKMSPPVVKISPPKAVQRDSVTAMVTSTNPMTPKDVNREPIASTAPNSVHSEVGHERPERSAERPTKLDGNRHDGAQKMREKVDTTKTNTQPRNLVPITIIKKAGKASLAGVKAPLFAGEVKRTVAHPLTAVVRHSTHIPDSRRSEPTPHLTPPCTVVMNNQNTAVTKPKEIRHNENLAREQQQRPQAPPSANRRTSEETVPKTVSTAPAQLAKNTPEASARDMAASQSRLPRQEHSVNESLQTAERHARDAGVTEQAARSAPSVPIATFSRSYSTPQLPASAISREDAPVTHITHNTPVVQVTRDAPVAHITRDAPVAHITRDAPVAHITHDAPVAHVTRDAPVAHITRDALVTNQHALHPTTNAKMVARASSSMTGVPQQTVEAAQSGMPYMQHTIAYVPCGNGYLPVIMPLGQPAIGALQHTYPWQALPPQDPLLNDGKDPNSLAAHPSLLSHAPSLDVLAAVSTHGSNMYAQMPASYGSLMQQYAGFQQRLGMKDVTQQPTTAKTTKLTAANPRPVAAVAAVPVRHTSQGNSSVATEEQPLNLSQKREQQPLNLKKPRLNLPESEPGARQSSVIKVAAPAMHAVARETAASLIPGHAELYRQNSAADTNVISALGNQVNPSILLPPPVVFPRALSHPLPTAAFSSLALPPIHYANGMPFILRFPPPSL